MKKFSYVLLILIVSFSIFNYAYAEGTEVVIHYHREDGNYKPWSVWAWGDNAQGSTFEFTNEDEFGAIAYINVKDADKVGFLLKQDDWSKDYNEDRFIDLSLGNEIWVKSELPHFSYELPQSYTNTKELKNFNLSFVYDRYDNNYSNVKLVYYEKNNEDNRGSIEISNNKPTEINISAKEDIIFSIYQNNQVYEYENSIIFTTTANEGDTLPVYLMQGLDKVQYLTPTEMQFNNYFESAYITDVDEITIKLNRPLKYDDGFEVFSVEDTEVYKVYAVPNSDKFEKLELNYSNEFILNTENLNIYDNYVVSKKNINQTITTKLGDIYDTEKFNLFFNYEGDDLGAVYTKNYTTFRVWSPIAKNMELVIYETENSKNDEPFKVLPMSRDSKGTWFLKLDGEHEGLFYNYSVTIDDNFDIAVDPYAKAVTLNGEKGVVYNAKNAKSHSGVSKNMLNKMEHIDSIIYEAHIRDLTVDDSSNIENKGKFLGLIELGVENDDGLSTGLNHIIDLGVTHIQILPIFDFENIDEINESEYSWGHETKNFSVPEGSYSTQPNNYFNRISEFKTLIKQLHENGIRVILDVSYNHTYSLHESNFEKLMPGYYFKNDKSYSPQKSNQIKEKNSERFMTKKFLVDNLKYWATEYQVDGFKISSMHIHEIQTIENLRQELEEINPKIIIYGEDTNFNEDYIYNGVYASKDNIRKLNSKIGFLNADFNEAILGSQLSENEKGFISSSNKKVSDVALGIVGSISHHQVSFDNSSLKYITKSPAQTINYLSTHHTYTVYDKLAISTNKDNEEVVNLNKIAATVLFTSQGIPLIQAGEEFGRTKNGLKYTNNLGDQINAIDWNLKTENLELFNYYKGLIELRKETKAFRYSTKKEIEDNLLFLDSPNNIIIYTVNGTEDDEYTKYLVGINPSNKPYTYRDETIKYDILVNKDYAGTKPIERIKSNFIEIKPYSAIVVGFVGQNTGISRFEYFASISFIIVISTIAFKTLKKQT